MGSVNRFLSASAAAWVKVLLLALTQVVLVPVFLSHWSVQEYGCWLIIQAIVSVSSILSLSHQNFIGFEFLKAGDHRPDTVRRLFYSALPYVFLIAVLEVAVLLSLIFLGFIDGAFDSDHSINPLLLQRALWSLIIYALSWLICNGVGGLALRAMTAYGYFPRVTWWSAAMSIAGALTSALAVTAGADLLWTVIWIAITTVAINIAFHLDLWRLLRQHQLYPVRPDWRFGLRNLVRSLAIAMTAVLDISRLQGVRIFLGGLVGIAEMTAFATMRTMNNLSLQGIGTITNPMMPEIMRFLHARDSERANAAAGFIWLMAVVLLGPVLIVFQWIMPVLFYHWTRGKISFNPALFGLFSITLLLYSLSRPSAAVLQGNNLLRAQLAVSIAMSAAAVSGIFLLTPALGVVGAATSMLLAELLGAVLIIWLARRWLLKSGIAVSPRLFVSALISITLTTSAIALMVQLPHEAVAVMIVSLALSGASCAIFVSQLPAAATAKYRAVLHRWLPLSR
jgi:O-antigen/teichoic acid export membrane protein